MIDRIKIEIDPQDQLDRVESHPIVLAMLDFWDSEIDEHPERLIPVTRDLMERMQKLTEGSKSISTSRSKDLCSSSRLTDRAA